MATPPPRRRRRGQRAAWVILAVLGVTIVVVIGTLIVSVMRSRGGTSAAYDPHNYGANGSAALAAIVDDHGIPVRVIRGLADLSASAEPDQQTTVVVTDSSAMTPETAAAFTARVGRARRIVLIEPSADIVAALGLTEVSTGSVPISPAAVQAGCASAGVSPGDTITAGPSGYLAAGGAPAAACFLWAHHAGLVVVPGSASRPEVVVMSGAMTTNSHLADLDNAGVSVRMLSAARRVHWYVPQIGDRFDAPKEQPTEPRIVGPTFVLGLFVLAAVAFWRGRRFGPLATEPLPAVVKAIETTQSRGRLYRKAGDAGRAAAVLRVQTTARLARYLGLPYDHGAALADLDRSPAPARADDPLLAALISSVASATGRHPIDVAALLTGPLPLDASGLVRFSADLTALDKEVRHTP